jgi:hypothetical protein
MNKLITWVVGVGIMASVVAVRAAEPVARATPKQATAPDSYQIRNKKFGQLLRPEEANSANGTPIVLYPAQSWKCMTWKMYSAGESVFQLQNHFTSKTFAAAAKADADQTAVTQVPFSKEAKDRPTWRFTKLPYGLYQIVEVKSGKALTAVATSGGDAHVVVARFGQGDEQKWELIRTDPAKLTM